MKTTIIYYLKVFGAMTVAFILASIIKTEFFVSNTPEVRRQLDKYFTGQFASIRSGDFSVVTKYFSMFQPVTQVVTEPLLKKDIERRLIDVGTLPLNQTAPGAYARETEEMREEVFNDGQTEWKEYTFTIRGETMKVKVPAGSAPPTINSVSFE